MPLLKPLSWHAVFPFVILGFLIYSNSLQTPFHFDDLTIIRLSPSVRMNDLTLDTIKKAAFDTTCPNRPIANVSFALNYYFHQYDVFGYHVINIIIHVLNGILLYLLIRITLSTPALGFIKERHRFSIALFGSLLWFVHPVQTQSVTYLVQRMTSMAAMFYLLSILLYAKGRLAREHQTHWPLFTGSAITAVLALGTKEIAVTLPLFILLYEWFFFQDLSSTYPRRVLPYILGILFVLVLLVFFYTGSSPFKVISSGYTNRDFSLVERVLTEFRVVILYISLLLYPNPSRLNLDYDFSVSHSLVDPTSTLFSIIAIAGLILFALYTARKERFISFCILWFLGNMALESSVIPLEIVYEHRMYLPSMFFFLPFLVVVHRFLRRDWAILSIASAVVILLCLWTYQRNEVWKDGITLWRDCVSKSGNKARPHNNLALALYQRGNIEEAITHYSAALRIEPDYLSAHKNLGHALAKQHRFAEAIKHFGSALTINPNDPYVHFDLADALVDLDKYDEAIDHYSTAIQIKPDYAKAHNNLGRLLALQGKLKKAIDHFTHAVEAKPDYAGAHYNLAMALTNTGNFTQALKHCNRAIQLGARVDSELLEFLQRQRH